LGSCLGKRERKRKRESKRADGEKRQGRESKEKKREKIEGESRRERKDEKGGGLLSSLAVI